MKDSTSLLRLLIPISFKRIYYYRNNIKNNWSFNCGAIDKVIMMEKIIFGRIDSIIEYGIVCNENEFLCYNKNLTDISELRGIFKSMLLSIIMIEFCLICLKRSLMSRMEVMLVTII